MKTSIKTLALAAVSTAALFSQSVNAAPSLSINQTSGVGTVSFAVSIDNPEALLTAFSINLALSNLGSGDYQSINWGSMFGTLDADPACQTNLLATGCTYGPSFSGNNVNFQAAVFPDFFGVTEDDLKLWQNYDSGNSAYAGSILLATLTFAAQEEGQYGARVTGDTCPAGVPTPNNPNPTYVAGQTVGGGNDPANDQYIVPGCAQAVPEPASLGLLGLGLLGTMVMRRRVAA